ncbi:hypothetical protein ES708_00044 [subsurface metagenome]
MGDIVLIEGNNELNVQMLPIVPIAGGILLVRMWHEPLASWVVAWTSPEIPLEVTGDIPVDGEIVLAPYWGNKSEVNIVGHIDLEVTYPDGTKHTLSDASIFEGEPSGQDRERAPGESAIVGFEPFVSSQEGTYTVEVTLSSAGQVLDSVTFELAAAKAVKISSITVSPTSLTTAEHEYETRLGLGFRGDPFTIRITFSNPFDMDIWVRPDYAFGHLTGDLGYVGGVLHGFNAEKLLYFRWLMDTEYMEGDYSYTVDWQKLYDVQNAGSNMPQFVKDPDGIAVLAGGGDCWLKVPAKGTATTVKNGHLSSELQVRAYECALCGMLIGSEGVKAHYAAYHPGIEIVVWSWGGLSGAYIKDTGENAMNMVYVPAPGIVGPYDLCVVANKVIYLYYEPHYRTVGGRQYLINWKSATLDPVAAAVPDMINITAA